MRSLAGNELQFINPPTMLHPSSRAPATPPGRITARLAAFGCLVALVLGSMPASAQTDDDRPVTVQPGGPGEPTRVLGSDEVETLDRPTYTEADIRFIRGMIRHHAQALDMVELLRDRTESEDLLRLALRIEISQEDEIALMEQWLRERNEPMPDGGGHRRDPEPAGSDDTVDGVPDAGAVGAPPAPVVPGMLTRAQMDELAGTDGEAFERLFLERMIQHHQGALHMVERLFRSPGGGQVSSVNHIAGEVQADQAMEIERMRRMLDERPDQG